MNVRVGLSFLILSIIGCICCDARNFEASDATVLETIPGFEIEYLEEYERNKKFCTLCEQFAGQAAEYLKENKTQTQIIDSFHQACLRLHSFQQQCEKLVDYYAPLFFLEVSSMRPHDFCRKINLCVDTAPPPSPPSPVSTSPPSPPSASPLMDPLKGERICDFCHNAVFKVLTRLKDPGTELRIVERLVKGCVVAERFADKCQSLVFQYGPVILVNVVRLLERADLCITLHACQGNRNETVVPYTSSTVLQLHDM
uniref:Pulmonary surfactant-associated protein B n=1 Tax=Anthurium amnicola TaxID=1678845 RepID=A0A1D1ZAY7_9ARAE